MQLSLFMNKENLWEYLQENPIGNVWHIGDYALTVANLTGVAGGGRHDSAFFRTWAKELQEMLTIPPFLGVDPIGEGFSTDVKPLINPPAVGAANSPELAYEFGKAQAKLTKSMGANYVWGPEVDIPSRFNAVSIMRSMSDNLEKLCRLSLSMVKGMQEHGVAGTVKHFPGTDQVEYRDPHFSPSYIHTTFEEWKKL